MKDSYLGMLHDNPFAQYNYYGSQVYVNVPATSPGPSSTQFYNYSNAYLELGNSQEVGEGERG